MPTLQQEIDFTRNLCCAMIKCAIDDCLNEKVYLRSNNNNHANVNRTSAVTFLKSQSFKEMCWALGLPADKFRKVAFR